MTPSLPRRFAVSLTSTALACAALAATAPAHAGAPSSWSPTPLGLPNQSAFASAVSADGTTVFDVALDGANPAQVDVTTTAVVTGETSGPQAISLDVDPVTGVTPDVTGIAVAGDGTLVVTDDANHSFYVGSVNDSDLASYTTPFDDLTPTISPDGHYAALLGRVHADTSQSSAIAVVDATAPANVTLSTTLVDTSAPNTTPSDAATTAAVGDDGAVAAAGLLDGAATAWTVPLGGDPQTETLAATGTPHSVVLLADGTAAVDLVDNTASTDIPDTVVYAGGSLDGRSTAIAGYRATLATDGTTVWAASGNDLERLDGASVHSQDGTDFEAVLGAAVSPAGDALYVADAAWEATEAQLQQFTTPPAPTTLDSWASSDTAIGLDWSAASNLPAVTPSYRIRLTDTGTSDVVEDLLANYNIDNAAAPATTVSGVDTSHGYAISVESFNGAFFSTPLTGSYLAPVPGSATATVTGTPTVGSTLIANVSGFQGNGITYSYEWGTIVVNGESGGELAIPGATGSTLALTPSLLGAKVTVGITAHRDGYAPTTVWSQPVVVGAAPSGPGTGGTTPPAPGPQQHLTGVSAPHVKASATSVTLTLNGVTTLPGKVTVHDGKKLLGTATVVDGKLVLKLHQKLSHGRHHLTLDYAGSAQASGFQQKVTLKVG